jgi:hypothetical protein
MSKGNVRWMIADPRFSLGFQEFVVQHLVLLVKMQTEMLQQLTEMNRWTSSDFSRGESVIEEVRA